MSKRLAKLFRKMNTMMKGNARLITKIFAAIGLVCVLVWFVCHFWVVIKVGIAIAILGIACGGLKN